MTTIIFMRNRLILPYCKQLELPSPANKIQFSRPSCYGISANLKPSCKLGIYNFRIPSPYLSKQSFWNQEMSRHFIAVPLVIRRIDNAIFVSYSRFVTN